MNDDALIRSPATLTLKQQNYAAYTNSGTPATTVATAAPAAAKDIVGTSVPASPSVNSERLSLGEVMNGTFSQ